MWLFDNWERRSTDRSFGYRLMVGLNVFLVILGLYLMISGVSYALRSGAGRISSYAELAFRLGGRCRISLTATMLRAGLLLGLVEITRIRRSWTAIERRRSRCTNSFMRTPCPYIGLTGDEHSVGRLMAVSSLVKLSLPPSSASSSNLDCWLRDLQLNSSYTCDLVTTHGLIRNFAISELWRSGGRAASRSREVTFSNLPLK